MLEAVLTALSGLRAPFAPYESDIHQLVHACLLEHALPARHEATIAKGCRVDFLVDNVCVEVKKGKPNPTQLLTQLRRYAACDGVDALVVVTQRSVRLPKTVCGKPLHVVCLNLLWGVAL